MVQSPLPRRLAKPLLIAGAVCLALGLQGCLAAAIGTTVGVAVGTTAKVGGAVVGGAAHVITGGKHKKKHRKSRDDGYAPKQDEIRLARSISESCSDFQSVGQ
jgi:hypothetical protein